MEDRSINRIIEMAWEDRTPFQAIAFQFGIHEKEVIAIMRRELSANAFKRWRKRVQGRKTKHVALRNFRTGRMKSKQQREISRNKYKK